MPKLRIGVLTGGGDVPGLNTAIKSIVYRAGDSGSEVIGIRRGWEGLPPLDLDDRASRDRYLLPLDRERTRAIDRTGGTILHTSRTNPSKMKKIPPHLAGKTFPSPHSTNTGVTSTVYDLSQQVLENLGRLKLDYLLPPI